MFLSFFFCFFFSFLFLILPLSLCVPLFPRCLSFPFIFSVFLYLFPLFHTYYLYACRLYPSFCLSLCLSICLYLSICLSLSLLPSLYPYSFSLSLSLFPVLLLLIFPPSFCSCFSPAHEIQAALLPRARRGSSTITLKAASTRVLFLLTSASLHGLYEPLYTKCECLLFMVTHYLFA